MPFTTMNNYNWLFDLSDRTKVPTTMQQSLSQFPAGQSATYGPDMQTMSYQATGQSALDAFRLSTEANGNSTSAPSFYRQTALQQSQNSAQFSGDHQYDFPGSQRMALNASASPSSLESQEGSHSYLGTDSSSPTSTSHEESAQGHKQNQPTRPLNRQISIPQSPFHPESFSTDQPWRSKPRIDETSRNDILDLLVNARPKTPDGSEISPEHPLLSLSCMQNYLDLFFSRFNVAYPLLHQASFNPSETETLLLLAVILLGATYSEKSIHRLAVCIHDVLRAQIFQHPAFSATPELWMLQTILLVECFGKSRAGQKQHDMAHLFHGLLINLIRRSDCQTVRQPNFREESGDLEDNWRRAIDVELRKRLAFLCFLWDTQHAILFSQSLCMSAFELRTTLPCNQTTWEASTAEEWWRHARKEAQIPFLSVLKVYMNPDSGAQIPELNALSRLLVLHGLMSIQWDLKRRDQTSLGVGTSDQQRWQDRLAQSYDAWKADFDTYCMNMTLSLSDSSSRRAEFTRFSTATIAIYHAAHITLNVEILDLQIYAGARHIIGHPVTRADYDRSRSVVKAWAKPGGSTPAAKAAWHAAYLLRDGIMNLENWDVNNAFHYPWCLYLSTLTCWVFHFANVADKSAENPLRNAQASSFDNDPADRVIWHAKAEMNALISSMTSVAPGDLWRVLGKHSTSGLVTVMSAHLANIRWAVIHEGRKVLKGIPPERSFQEYNACQEYNLD
ncbi:uncharacterized protein Z519_02158 [Cladophialophora bantiana CBS 173.52]|uniref:Xylanolytic transcriptional activator regulatory domain-containing protein n=1 Tax=Cladophialophora bantiana (strain ATCC 10958 / CBS 173.52 / CDC B-1940 / NIH 8579) TaxID=1442370 RepID=A0A0D2GEE6_CLAB1|nr:uncharacterized protein Z519_02158 [Cladophialophora bantiana CBS 173.52]KIW96767.1 hypothetical protein Z519_02158 [Cladophialophora bantiana CBS 173.52]